MAKTTVEFPESITVQLREGTLARIERLVGSKYKRPSYIREAAERRLMEDEAARGVRPQVLPEVEAVARLLARAVHQRRVEDPTFDLDQSVESDWSRFVDEAQDVVAVVEKAKSK